MVPAASGLFDGTRSTHPMNFSTLLKSLRLLGNSDALSGLAQLQRDTYEINQLRRAFPESIIDSDVLVQGWPKGELNIPNIRIERGSILCVGDDINGYGSISVGYATWIGPYNNIRTSEDARIEIGSKCLISQYCSIVGANHGTARNAHIQDQRSDSGRKGVVIADDVWLGVGCSVLPGVSIGEGAIIGANSVVTRNVSAFEIWVGSPARKTGERT